MQKLKHNPFECATLIVTKKQYPDITSYNSFMVQRILSMDVEFLPIISNLQRSFKTLSNERQLKLLFSIIPKRNSFYIKYIKKEN